MLFQLSKISIFSLLVLLFSCFLGTSEAGAQVVSMSFNDSKSFKIVQFTDIHWDPKKEAIKDAKETMELVLEQEKPDLVIFSGDIVVGAPISKAIDSVFMIVEKRRIPFAYTFGNHDDEADMSRSEIFEYLKKFRYNVTTTTEGISGITNYVIEIKGAEGSENKALIYIIDTHAYSPLKEKGIGGYDWIKADQIQWYVDASRSYAQANGGVPLPALAYFHIPIPEYNIAAGQEKFKLIGHRLEKACAPEINTGLGAAILDRGDVMATFVGHDHVNDYIADYYGVKLIYGRCTGGELCYGNLSQGARVVELKEGERSFKTWMVLRDGSSTEAYTFSAK